LTFTPAVDRYPGRLFGVQESLSESYPATPAAVPAARHAVGDYAVVAGAGPDQLDAIRLAVSEAVTNAVKHAYPDGGGEIHMTAAALDGELWILVADEGVGVHTPTQDPGLGLGLALIADACEEFVITERAEGGTEARMRFVFGDAD